MEKGLLVGIAAAILAFPAAYAASRVALGALWSRRASVAAQGGPQGAEGIVAWRVRNGYGFMKPAARWLLRFDRVSRFLEDAVRMCSLRGKPTTAEALLSVVLVAAVAAGAGVGVATGSPVGAVAAVACLLVAVGVAAGSARDKRQEAVRDAVPDALASMSACFASGFTLVQTFKQVSDDVQGPLGKTFARSAHLMEMGSGAEKALEELRRGANASELAFVAVALDVQHQSGGAIGQVLDAATDAVKGEMALRRSLRVQTAQAKLSARVVSVMPLVLITAFSLVSPDFLTPFFASPYGYALLAVAVVMQVAGIFLVRRALTVEGVS